MHVLIKSASTLIDRYTGKSYKDIDDEEDGKDEERLYDGNGHKELFIDDYTSITKIELLDAYGDLYQELIKDDYILYPLNTSAKNSIHLRYYHFPKIKAGVRVTGVFTSGETPEEVILAATALVARALAQAKLDGNELSSENIEGYSRTFKKDADSDISDILSKLSRKIDF